MNIYETNIRAFVKLIESRGLTTLEQTELLQLVQQSENNLEQQANELIKRCQAASMGNELANYRRTLLPATSAELGFSDQLISKEAGEQACQDLLRNAIQTSKVLPPNYVPTLATGNPGEVPKPSEKKP